jgi:ureidoacrylate peracid hydrolase
MPALDPPLTRDLPLKPDRSALLVVDVQNYCAHRSGGAGKGLAPEAFNAKYGWLFERLERQVIPNLKRLIAGARAAGMEIIYTKIESLTKDGRDRSLDYKISGFNVPRGSWDGQIIEALTPAEDDIVLPKTASGVFNATNIDYVLRNLGVERLAIGGLYSDQCVESAVRDACDKGYLVTLVEDACATFSPARHANTLSALTGYCRMVRTADVLAELAPARRQAG